MPSRSWEDEPDARDASRHAWEAESVVSHDAGSDSSTDVELLAEAPADSFASDITALFLARTLGARQFCVLVHDAGEAGAAGASALGLPPNRP